MPTINKPKKKTNYPKTGQNIDIAKIYNTPQWKKLRKWQITEHPLCEDCLNEHIINDDGQYGERITCADEVHHITPISTAETRPQMEDLAYNPQNLVSLCRFHHHLRHKTISPPLRLIK